MVKKVKKDHPELIVEFDNALLSIKILDRNSKNGDNLFNYHEDLMATEAYEMLVEAEAYG